MKKYYSMSEITERYGISRATVYTWMKNGFPKPVRLAGLSNRWLISDVNAWEEDQK